MMYEIHHGINNAQEAYGCVHDVHIKYQYVPNDILGINFDDNDVTVYGCDSQSNK